MTVMAGSDTSGSFHAVTHLSGWLGQLGCTGVGAAELGLISMAL